MSKIRLHLRKPSQRWNMLVGAIKAVFTGTIIIPDFDIKKIDDNPKCSDSQSHNYTKFDYDKVDAYFKDQFKSIFKH